MTERTFGIAVLCTANRFRSPLTAALIQAETRDLQLRIRSFAVSGPTGPPALPQALARGRSLNVDLSEHRATELQRGELAAADLVLGFERSHVAAAVIEGGAARERTFTLPEFVPLAEDALVEGASGPVRRARLVIEAAAAARPAAARGYAELGDPAGGPESGYDKAAAEIADLSRRLVQALFGPRNS